MLLELLAPHKALCDIAVPKRVVLICVPMTPTVLLKVTGDLFGLQDRVGLNMQLGNVQNKSYRFTRYYKHGARAI